MESPLGEGVGAKTAKALERAFGMTRVGDLLRHYPRRLAERGELTDLRSLARDEDVTVMAEVFSSEIKGFGKSQRLEVIVGDGRDRLQLVFFGNRQLWRQRDLQPGVRGLFSGKVGEFNNRRQLAHPDYMILAEDTARPEYEADMFASRVIPVYAATKDARSWVISSAVRQVLDLLDELSDPDPADVRARHGLMSYDKAVRAIHQPATKEEWFAAKHRLAWDEAFAVQLVLA
jgi:ATP-dependent DNA helicase RecG